MTTAPFDPSASPAAPVDRSPGSPIVGPAELLRLGLLAAIGLLLGLSPFLHGAYSSGVWAPAGLGVGAVLVGLLAMGARRPPPAAMTAIAALTGLGLLTLISKGWSPTPGLAAEHGQRLLVLAGLLAILLTLVRDRRSARVALAATIAGVAIVGLWTLRGLLGATGNELFVGGRLNSPLEYINGQGSIYVLAFAAALALTGARTPLAAGLGAAFAALFADLALLSQSRAVLITLVVAAAVVVLCTQGRLRRGAGVCVVGIAVATAAPSLLDLLGQSTPQGLPVGATQPAGRATLVSMLLAGVVWGAATAVASAVRDETTRLRLRQGLAGVLAAAVLVGLVGAGVNAGRIADRVSEQVDAFVNVEFDPGAPAPTNRLLSGSGTRYDYWRVATGTFADHPFAGAGGGGFVVDYYRERATPENILQAHSVTFQTMADLGLLGLALLAAFYAAVGRGLVGAVRRRGDRTPTDGVIAAAGCGMVTAWVLHSNVDWILLLPGVTGVAFVGLAVVLRPAEGEPAPSPLPRSAGVALALLAGAIVVVTTLGLVQRLQVRHDLALARAAQVEDPARAVRLADRAIDRDPDALEGYYLRAAALARQGQPRPTIATLRKAAARQPAEFVTWGLLGDVLARSGDRAAARRAYGRAVRLNPRDQALRDALAAAGSDAP